MFLKFETIFNVYEHKSKTILCRVKVLTTNDSNNKNGSSPTNTCRLMTTDKWNEFDNELKSWVVLNENKVFDGEEPELCRLIKTPNLQIYIKKCKLGFQDFLKCVNTDDDCYDAANVSNGEYGFPYVLDCILEHTSMPPTTTTLNTEEYEPHPATSINNSLSISSLSGVPYTPSKRSRRFRSECRVKTPCYDISSYDAVEATYSPRPFIKNSSVFDPAPICKRSTSFESQVSNQTDVIIETEDERVPSDGYRTIRKRLRSKSNKAIGENEPQTFVIESHIPANKPSPIESVAKRKNKLNPNDMEHGIDRKAEAACDEKSKPQEDNKSSKGHKKKEKHYSIEYVGENENKRPSKEKLSSSSKESKKRLNSTCSSEGEFESALHQQKAQGKNKENYKGKDTVVDVTKIDKRQGSPQKNKDKSSTKIKKPSLSSSDGEYKANNSQKRDIQNQDRRQKEKDKEKKKSNEREEATKSYENKSLNQPKDGHISSIRRSERSPAKPKRFIEEQEKYKCRKKHKMNRLSPLKNKELFRTHDDDDDIPKLSDTNNNGSDMNKSGKKNTFLSSIATPSSASKKKRHRDNCEQEKADMSKWLTKKSSSKTTGSSNISEEGTSSSKGKSSSTSSKEKASKKSKLSKDENKERSISPSPPSMDIVMPSKEEMEIMRNKLQRQREENKKVKALLEKINIPAPKKVDHLSLKDMSLNELLDSYASYREELDQVFKKNCKTDHVKGNDGINHCVVIGLIDQQLQLKMLEKLADVYSSNTNHTTHATLYANALLPEWIVRIFMTKYNLSRRQAIEQIQDQDAYKSYMDDQNETSLRFDY